MVKWSPIWMLNIWCNISKIINSIFGGMVITRNDKTNKLLKDYREKNQKNLLHLKRLKD